MNVMLALFDIVLFIRLNMDNTDLNIKHYHENATKLSFTRISVPVQATY